MSTIDQFKTQEELDLFVLGLGQLKMSLHYYEFGLRYQQEASGYFEDAVGYFERLVTLNNSNSELVKSEVSRLVTDEYIQELRLIKYKITNMVELFQLFVSK